MKRTSVRWEPRIGAIAHYHSRYSGLTRGCPVRVVAEAVGQRRVVEIIGHAGTPVRVTVKAVHLHPMPPGLFDSPEFALT